MLKWSPLCDVIFKWFCHLFITYLYFWYFSYNECCELNCVPLKDVLKSCTLVPVNVMLFGSKLRWGHIRLEWGQINMTGVLVRKNKSRDTQGERHVTMEAETGTIHWQAKEPPGLPATRKAKGEAGKEPPLGPPGKQGPATPWFGTSSL